MTGLIKFFSSSKSLLSLGALFIGFNLLIPLYLPKDHALDLRFAYSPEVAHSLLSELNPDQVKNYFFGLWALDMPYLVIYGFLLSGLLLRIWGNSWVIRLPFLISAFDFLENVVILSLLQSLPQKVDELYLFASFFSSAKWSFVLLSFTAILVGGIRKLMAKKPILAESREIKI